MIPPGNLRQVPPRAPAVRRRARRRAPAAFRPRVEAFEDRLLPALFTVTVVDDAGPGSLRQALLDANANPGPDTIAFDVGGGGVQTIRPAAPLPAATDVARIDGTTQPGYAGAPLIVLDGRQAGANADGLALNADGGAVLALVVGGFGGSGVVLRGNNNRVEGCHLGTDVTGTKPLGNGRNGVMILNGERNVVGGTKPEARNLLSGNVRDGVFIFARENRVEGNFIGTDASGTRALGNGGHGVSSVLFNLVGGAAAGAGNLIAGNGLDGVNLSNGGRLEGNFIGTDVAGTKPLGNGRDGVSVLDDAMIGTAAGAGNLIAGNQGDGVRVRGSDNRVEGNRIGTDITGTAALSNATGLFLAPFAFQNAVGGPAPGAGNLIAGNRLDGVFVDGARNRVEGNRIGTDVTGTAALPNGWGVYVYGGTGHVVGGAAPGAGNLISGNLRDGVFVAAAGTRVQGNRIGTDAAGTRALGNGLAGVSLAAAGLVGGPGAGNVIAGNRGDGVRVTGAGGRVEGNLIGTDITGTAALANAGHGVAVTGAGNVVGGVGAGNLIAGNGRDGVFISAMNNRVEGNYIGTDVSGTAPLGNARGVAVGDINFSDEVRDNVVGGAAAGAGNLIAGNRGVGVVLVGRDNRAEGNYIGTDVTGTAALRNGGSGASVIYAGTGAVVAGNLIAGNAMHGVAVSSNTGPPFTAANRVEGNLIGTDASGTAALGNGGHGVFSGTGSVVAGNVISGNQGDGVSVFGRDARIEGNLIGTDATGTRALGNTVGVRLGGTAHAVGGPGAGNVISGNRAPGVEVTGSGHRVQGNFVGTDVTGTQALGNGGAGVAIQGPASNNNAVGGGAGNMIAFNGGAGVLVVRGTGNAIRQNAVFANAGLGIELRDGGNNNQAAPDLTAAVSGGGLTRVAGTLRAAPNMTFTVELFANAECDPSGFGEGEQFLVSFTVTTDAAGEADFAVDVGVEVPPGHFLTATAPDPGGNTSAFARCREVGGRSGGAAFPLDLLRKRAGAAGAA